MQRIESLISRYSPGDFSGRNVYEIPVVVHVVYKTGAENISDAQVYSQIDALNADFQLQNSDASQIPSVWQSLAANTGIRFCLARRDPQGNATSGITRTATQVPVFSMSDEVKFDASGGKDAWPTDEYLNLWVCALDGGLLGYSSFPGGDPSVDGVVIHHTNFGTNGTVQPPFHRGRTATHEVGHWLNLFHIWGDEPQCVADDNVADTPQQKDSNVGCPNFPLTSGPGSACSGSSGAMFMNYMDYVDDACMVMFTQGQRVRMLATLAIEREAILESPGCYPPGVVLQDCDTLRNFPDTAGLFLYSPGSLGFTGDGYISGTNSLMDLAKADEFTGFQTGARLEGAILHFAKAYTSGPGGFIRVSVWDNSGSQASPGSVLSSVDVSLDSIAAHIAVQQPTYVMFPAAVTIPSRFYLGIEIDPFSSDTVALFTSENGGTVPATAWEQWSDNSWHPYDETSTWGAQVSHAVFPIVCVSTIGLEETFKKDSFSFVPNPFIGEVTLQLNDLQNAAATCVVRSVSGEVVLRQQLVFSSSGQAVLDLGFLPAGAYVMSLSDSGNANYSRILIKQ